jgi:hypothetical protein
MSSRIRLIVMLAAALLALAWMYGRFRPSASVTADAHPAAPVAAESRAQTPVSEARPSSAGERADNAQRDGAPSSGHFRVTIGSGSPGDRPPVLKARQGDAVTIDITSDRQGTLEIHGYRKEVAVMPENEATVTFVATRAGRFPIDLHGRDGRHLEVTALEVEPR